MKTIEEQAKEYIKDNDHTTDVLGWEWDTNHAVTFAKLMVQAQRARDEIEIEFWRTKLESQLLRQKIWAQAEFQEWEIELAKLLEGK